MRAPLEVVGDQMEQGTKVEVRSTFDHGWKRGFAVDHVDADGVWVRRLSDGELLPVAFAAEDVRRERRSSMWWY